MEAEKLDLFSTLPPEIIRKIFQYNEPSTKADYLQYYGNILSLKKDFRDILDTRVEEQCGDPSTTVNNILWVIYKDVESMKKNGNYRWNLECCLINITHGTSSSVLSSVLCPAERHVGLVCAPSWG